MAHAEEPPNDSDTSNGPQAQPTTFTLSTDTPFPLPPKAATAQDASTTPSLPPAMDSVRAHSADEIIQMMKKTPLFMTDLEEGSEGNEGNTIPLLDDHAPNLGCRLIEVSIRTISGSCIMPSYSNLECKSD